MKIDFETFHRLAVILFVPFFTTAAILDGWLLRIGEDIPAEYEIIGLVIRFTILVVGFYIVHTLITPFIFRYATYGNHQSIELMPLPLVVGLICLAFGLYGASTVLFPTLDLPKSPVNLFWHLGILAYGFFLLL